MASDNTDKVLQSKLNFKNKAKVMAGRMLERSEHAGSQIQKIQDVRGKSEHVQIVQVQKNNRV